jgi:glycosyltransferase involved in cell wall biosynthesis
MKKLIKTKKALIISFSNLNTDPRVLRQIDFIGTDFEIHTAGIKASDHRNEISHKTISTQFTIDLESSNSALGRWLTLGYQWPICFFNWVRNYFTLVVVKNHESNYWTLHKKKLLNSLLEDSYDLIVANDIHALPLAIKIKERNGSKVYFDAHEYSPLEYENDAKWLTHWAPYYTYLCEKYIPSADYCTTVAKKIAEKYYILTGKKFDVVYNAPQYQVLSPSPITNVIKCVHHGVASPIREIESMINAFKELGPGFELHLLLVVGDVSYYNYLKQISEGHKNILFHKPVATQRIPAYINQFDISLVFIPPVNFNYKYCLPNKFFESIQARLMLVSGPSAEMEFLIKKFQLGKISDGFKTAQIVEILRSISVHEIEQFKNSVDSIAGTLSAEATMHKLKNRLDLLVTE